SRFARGLRLARTSAARGRASAGERDLAARQRCREAAPGAARERSEPRQPGTDRPVDREAPRHGGGPRRPDAARIRRAARSRRARPGGRLPRGFPRYRPLQHLLRRHEPGARPALARWAIGAVATPPLAATPHRTISTPIT